MPSSESPESDPRELDDLAFICCPADTIPALRRYSYAAFAANIFAALFVGKGIDREPKTVGSGEDKREVRTGGSGGRLHSTE